MAVRTIEVRERVMARNDELAAEVRAPARRGRRRRRSTWSPRPGSGKTLLLERTLEALGEELGIAVVTGDVQTQNDADRLARHTDRLVQAVVTGGACHLDAQPGADRARRHRPRPHPAPLHRERRQPGLSGRAGTWARRPRSWSSRSPRARTSRSSIPRCSARRATRCSTRSTCCPTCDSTWTAAVANARQVNPELQFFLTSALDRRGAGRSGSTSSGSRSGAAPV